MFVCVCDAVRIMSSLLSSSNIYRRARMMGEENDDFNYSYIISTETAYTYSVCIAGSEREKRWNDNIRKCMMRRTQINNNVYRTECLIFISLLSLLKFYAALLYCLSRSCKFLFWVKNFLLFFFSLSLIARI